jgi:hypothetical protein
MKISGKRPVMFFQDGYGTYGASGGCRVRIFFPGGKAEWCALRSSSERYDFIAKPCWLNGKRPKTISQLIKMAHEYDKKEGFPKMEFLGEL